MQETQVQSLGQEEDPLEEEMATHCSILAGESHRQSSLAGYGPWGLKELDTAYINYLAFIMISTNLTFYLSK